MTLSVLCSDSRSDLGALEGFSLSISISITGVPVEVAVGGSSSSPELISVFFSSMYIVEAREPVKRIDSSSVRQKEKRKSVNDAQMPFPISTHLIRKNKPSSYHP
jgi:hypothetical protein